MSPLIVSLCPFGFCFSLVWFCSACIHAWSLSCVRLFATLWALSHQAPLSMGFPRQEYWSELPFPLQGDFPDLGIEFNISCVSCTGRPILYHWATWETLWFCGKNTWNEIFHWGKKKLSAQYSVVIYRQNAAQQVSRTCSSFITRLLHPLNTNCSFLHPFFSPWQPPFYSRSLLTWLF